MSSELIANLKNWLCSSLRLRCNQADSEGATAESIEEKFAQVMKNLGAMRRFNPRSIGIDVTDAFDDIRKAHSPGEFAQWIEERYGLASGKDVAGNHKGVYLYWKDLRRFSRRFSWWDRVLIQFKYSNDWRRIESFHASIQWTLG